ncbi:hypothetical protein [Vibrio coralliilyticus]|uniref:hypothetical protein n=1 Tax=Vibrio coralliilyticus TaxID=190893 RepID=UPI0017B64FD1|nr:hypothetical protein [Vibrio coralliilyticus]NUW69565.1 hypothetical protein [Vibrio coralliilyticus]
MPTTKGLAIIASIKAKHFPHFGKRRAQGGIDYRFTRKGQREYRQAMKQKILHHAAMLR